MRKSVTTPFTHFKAMNIDTALFSFTICYLLMTTGLAFAESESDFTRSLHSMEAYPLLADARSGDWRYDRNHSPDKSDRRQEPHNRDKSRYQRDHRVVKEYRTESRHHVQPNRHPHYQRPRPPYGAGPRHHHPRNQVVIVRPFRYGYPHHRHYHAYSDSVWGLLSFTAITLAILDNLNAQQQREHEQALYSATNTPMGETIYWKEGNASGTVTPVQEGTSSAGRYCREFRNEVSIDGKQETVFGTACRNSDGSWEIVQ